MQTHPETRENGSQVARSGKGTDSEIREGVACLSSDHTIVFFTQNVLAKGDFTLPQKVKSRGGKSSVRLVSICREETGGRGTDFSSPIFH